MTEERWKSLKGRVRSAFIAHVCLCVDYLLGKITCPRCSCFCPTKVVDGTVHQRTDLTTVLLRSIDDGIDENSCEKGVDDEDSDAAALAEWRREVAEAVQALTEPARTVNGRPASGPPRFGGVLAPECHLLPFLMDELAIACYGRKRFPAVMRAPYRLNEVCIYLPLSARADEQRDGEHLSTSTMYEGEGGLRQFKSKLATPNLDAVFATFLAADEPFASICTGLQARRGVVKTELVAIWRRFRCAAEDAGQDWLPERLGPGPIACFLQVMMCRIFKNMNSCQEKLQGGARLDAGPATSVCCCGLKVTSTRLHIGTVESPLRVSTSLLGGVNHLPNLILYDAGCRKGLAGQLPQRFTSLLARMGGPERMGGAFPLSELHQRWSPRFHLRKRKVIPWLAPMRFPSPATLHPRPSDPAIFSRLLAPGPAQRIL